MASIRFLKKQISSLSNELAAACLLSKAELTGEDVQKVNEVLADIYNFEDTYRLKAQNCDAKDNKKLVRQYYSHLYKEMSETAGDIIKKIQELNN
ncbi:MAG: hypothetical protein Q4F97_05215 [Bacteroidales bacterium]|nr:hypothetical protein [Bacteroidales bacterium]